jgi:aspartate kinase
MAGKTNELVAWTDGAGRAAQGLPLSDDEYDVVVASGEQVTAGLLAMTLRNMGLNARSWLGWQMPIITDDAHGRARIEDIPPSQSGSRHGRGRRDRRDRRLPGRHPPTAASPPWAAAAPTPARWPSPRRKGPCDIYTDVDGVYTTDPRIESQGRKPGQDLLRGDAGDGLAGGQGAADPFGRDGHGPSRPGAGAVEFRRTRRRLPAKVHHRLRRGRNRGKAHRLGRRLQPRRSQDHPAGPARPSGRLLADLRPPGRRQRQRRHDRAVAARTADTANMEFTVGKRDAARAVEIVRAAKTEIGFEDVAVNEDVAKVSVIGVGMRSHAGVAQSMFAALADKGVNIQVISTSEIKISVLIDAAYTELAVRALHAVYGLDQL